MSGVSTPQANRFLAIPFSFEELESDTFIDITDEVFNCDVDTDDFFANTDGEGVEPGFDQANGFFAIASALNLSGSADAGTDCLDADCDYATTVVVAAAAAAATTWREESGLFQANALPAVTCVFNVGESMVPFFVVLSWCAFDMEGLKFLACRSMFLELLRLRLLVDARSVLIN